MTRAAIAIVGGGMVGSALAALLARAGLDISLIERVPPEAPDVWQGWDSRVSALNRASQRILETIGAWPLIGRRQAYREMHVWDARSRGSIHFDCADIGEPDLGHIVENRETRCALQRVLDGLDTVRIYPGADIERIRMADDGVHIDLTGRTIHAGLVVGADGAHSAIRGFGALGVRARPYGQHALVATIRTGAGHAETAWQRFLPEGPLAVLPLPGDYASIVWSATPKRADELIAMPGPVFEQVLAEALEGRVGETALAGERLRFPLIAREAEHYVADGIALVGDAAHTIHPLAGLGVNLGFLDAAALAETLASAHRAQRPLGGYRTLRRYERWRRGHNQAVQWAMRGFKDLFSVEAAPVAALRGFGVNLVDAAAPLKTAIIRRAMGLEGDFPAAARAAAGVEWNA